MTWRSHIAHCGGGGKTTATATITIIIIIKTPPPKCNICQWRIISVAFSPATTQFHLPSTVVQCTYTHQATNSSKDCTSGGNPTVVPQQLAWHERLEGSLRLRNGIVSRAVTPLMHVRRFRWQRTTTSVVYCIIKFLMKFWRGALEECHVNFWTTLTPK